MGPHDRSASAPIMGAQDRSASAPRISEGAEEEGHSSGTSGHESLNVSPDSPNPGSGHGHGHGHRHIHPPLNKEKALKCPSLSFAPVYAEKFNEGRRDHAKKSKMFALMSAVFPMLVGAVTALCAIAVGWVTEYLGEYRIHWVQEAVKSDGWVMGWLVSTGFMLTFALVGSLAVIFYAKSSGSSGIPAVIAMLNGCDLRSDISWQAVLVKLFGVMMAVSSGLAVGPEGPMIFIGAGIGAFCSRLPSHPHVWTYFRRPPSTLNKHVYLRDYTAAGAGCGIAAAFRAPIAGTMFVVEEAASHFSKEILAKVFFAGVAALFVVLWINDGKGLLEYKVATGEYCQNWPKDMIPAIAWFVSIGAVCGLAGALFNHINVEVTAFRVRHINPSAFRRVLDICFLCLLTSSSWVLLASYTGEIDATTNRILASSTGCMEQSLLNQVIQGVAVVPTSAYKESKDLQKPRGKFMSKLSSMEEDDEPKSIEKYIPTGCLYGVMYAPTVCHAAFNLANGLIANSTPQQRAFANTCTLDLQKGTTLENLPRKDYYCCYFEIPTEGEDSLANLKAGHFSLPGNASCHLQFGDYHFPTLTENDKSMTFNPMAGLSLVPFAHTAQNLFTRGAPFIIPIETLLLYLPFFFLLAAVTAGSAIPSGLLLPQIIIGALIGRVITCIVIIIQTGPKWFASASISNSIWSPEYLPFFQFSGGPLQEDAVLTATSFPEPGVGAIIGAAAFLCGSGRITLFIVVMLVEITGDPIIILPVGVASMIAMIVGNLFNHGLYHMLIDVQSFPFLPDRWPKKMPTLLRIDHILPNLSTCTVPLAPTKAAVQSVLDGCNYKSFPVVNAKGVAVGSTQRKQLEELKQQGMPLYLPKVINGARVLEPVQDSGRGEHSDSIPQKWRAANSGWYKDNNRSGLDFRRSKSEDDKIPEGSHGSPLPWNDTLDGGIDEGDGWVRFSSDYVDVGSITDAYPIMVRDQVPVRVAYQLFKSMEMRQLIVTDDDHRPIAVLTRKTFLPWVVEERLEETDGSPMGARTFLRPSAFYASGFLRLPTPERRSVTGFGVSSTFRRWFGHTGAQPGVSMQFTPHQPHDSTRSGGLEPSRPSHARSSII